MDILTDFHFNEAYFNFYNLEVVLDLVALHFKNFEELSYSNKVYF